MNYATPVSIYGMLPANAQFVEGGVMAVYKNGKRGSVISWDPSYENAELPVSYMYVQSPPPPGAVQRQRRFQLLNGPFDSSFFEYRGEAGRHFRECRNKFRRLGVVTARQCDTGLVLDLIRRWEERHGRARYGMMMHSSYDKRFFRKSLASLSGRVETFYFMLGGECVGYKVLDATPSERPDGLLEFRSMLRKYDPLHGGLCRYVDVASYEALWRKWGRPFCVNVGCSSGGVAKYKTEKFPVMDAGDPVYFYKNGVAAGRA